MSSVTAGVCHLRRLRPSATDCFRRIVVVLRADRRLAADLQQLTAVFARDIVESPGMGTAGVGIGPHLSSAGINDSGELSASSQVTVLPVYADMRPMIAVSELSVTCLSSLSGLPD